ncbi:Putative GPI anchored protein [Penicillium brasilianum]|uniref:Putative GPI anchored protein n=1 Tax=Penicillium brasilianum TaxID=104259 RepID=A0A0F7TSB0_PENBI|nr:Putative GPI anchored protein [Penicillium brasilianum]
MNQSSNRTQIPISGSFPVALKMGHSQTAVEVLLALGSNPGDNYNITLVHTFQVTGLGAFCLPHVEFSDDILGVNITDGLNATLQVQSNGDPSGGLYACADVQFSSSVTYSEPSSCTNNTNVVASAFSGAAAQRNANESTSTGSAQSSSSSSSSSSSNTTSTTSKGAAVPLQTAAWGLLGAAFAGGMAVL